MAWIPPVAAIEDLPRAVVARAAEHPPGTHIPRHHHRRPQLLWVLSGMAMSTAAEGRWLVPAGHALWIPGGVEHGLEAVEAVSVRSVYVAPDIARAEGLPAEVGVFRLPELMRALMQEAATFEPLYDLGSRADLIMRLILVELARLSPAPLALPLPGEARLANLCRRFLEAPTPHATIEAWAAALAMSRRTFTRHFRDQTGMSFSAWRQHACLLAALPRLSSGEPVTSVALDLGYDSPAAFATMFRRLTGAAPSAYLRS